MAYEKQTWVDNETVIDAARMQHIEEGIEDVNNSLAEFPSQIEYGMESSLRVEAGTYEDFAVEFSTPFKSVPYIFLSEQSTSTSMDLAYITVAVGSRDTSGFNIRIFNDGTGARQPNVNWLAIL